MLPEEDFAMFKEDVKVRGQLEDIVLLDGKVLDGRNRLRACRELGLEPQWCELTQCDDPIAYVLSKNLHRRHLSQSQRAQCAADVAELRLGSNQHAKKEGPQNCGAIATEDAAKVFSVSTRSVETAKHVSDHGDKAVVDAVKAGEITVSAAAKLVDAVPERKRQRQIVKRGKKAVAAAIKGNTDFCPAVARPDEPPEKLSWQLQAAIKAAIRMFAARHPGVSSGIVSIALQQIHKEVDNGEECWGQSIPSKLEIAEMLGSGDVGAVAVGQDGDVQTAAETVTAAAIITTSATDTPVAVVIVAGKSYEVEQHSGTWMFRLNPAAGWTAASPEMVAMIEKQLGQVRNRDVGAATGQDQAGGQEASRP
jgi:hypothetical protein